MEGEKIALRAVALQEAPAAEFDLMAIDGPISGHFTLLTTGSLPAGVVAGIVRPQASWQRRNKLWDPLWFLILEGLAIPLWAAIGTWASAKSMRVYLILRALIAAVSIAFGGGEHWALLQIGFWLWLLLTGARKLITRAVGRRAPS